MKKTKDIIEKDQRNNDKDKVFRKLSLGYSLNSNYNLKDLTRALAILSVPWGGEKAWPELLQ